ncbi:MAG: hypothetical protein ABFR82_02350 [Nitrospirota bacterium]
MKILKKYWKEQVNSSKNTKKLVKFQDDNKEERISQDFKAGEFIDQHISLSKIYAEKSEELYCRGSEKERSC